jgi:dienelactone hydrolase
MTRHRALSFALITFAGVALFAALAEGQRMDEAASHASVLTSQPLQAPSEWSLCGAGKYELAAAGQSVGSETFEIICTSDRRYSASGRTQLSAGALALDLTTTIELGPDLVPVSASSKGTAQGQPLDQSGTFANGVATLVTNGKSQSILYQQGASWMGGNIFFPNVFILARCDESKGGVQQFPVFPSVTVTVERKAEDGVKSDGGESASFTRFVMRVATQEIVYWRDAAGRLAIIALPAQRFTASRPESAKWAPLLLTNLANPSPSSPSSSPSSSSSASNTVDYSAPATAPFSAEEVSIPVSSYALAGTLLLPKSGKRPFTAVVMITGSGLQTRDSRIPMPGLEQYAPFRQIAERLASNGVAVLRVDDRGIGGSTGRETLENATTTSLAEDTRAQIAWLRTRADIDGARIIVVGHSEGASIASMIGASDPKLLAVVMMAGPGKRGGDISIEQQEDMLRSDTTMTDAMKATLRQQQKDAVKTVLAGGDLPGQKFPAWGREYFAYDPLPTIRKVKQPLLILQGERDRQIDQSHATLLLDAARSAGNSRVTMKIFPTLNHLFLPSKTGSASEYSHLETNVVPGYVLDTIASWIKSLPAA